MTDNRLYYGDCLDVLRDMGDEAADLVYLDPPFNSKRDYNTFFTPKNGTGSVQAQIVAFEDTWRWGEQAEREFGDLLRNPNSGALGEKIMPALRAFLGINDMMAYLVMMASRLVELKRVLKPTGSLYLHCDPTASHYLKLLLDGVFGPENYRTEISWRRQSAHNDARQGRKQYGNIRDIIFFYTKSNKWTWNWQYTPYSQEHIEKNYRHVDENGRKYCLGDLTAAKGGGDTSYEFHGTYPYKGRFWAYSRENMEKFYNEGRLHFPKGGGTPLFKRYLDEMPGVPLQNSWDDIASVRGNEYLGYPTQKPVALLERIINTSSNQGDVVLDPFCGCGTSVHAAQKLGRRWIGIDITHLAITLIKSRINHAFPDAEFSVEGTPKDVASARYLAENNGLNGRYQFQYWALSLINALPSRDKKKGADKGVDGFIWAYDSPDPDAEPFKIIISVKSGKIPANHVRELAGLIRDEVKMAFLLSLDEPGRVMRADAVAAGEYEYPNGKRFPRLQLFTIQELLDGKMPLYLDYGEGRAMNPKAKREKKADLGQKGLFEDWKNFSLK